MSRANPDSETGAMQAEPGDPQRNLNPKQPPRKTSRNGGARDEDRKEIRRSLSSGINPKQVPNGQLGERHLDASQVSSLQSLDGLPVLLFPGVNPKDLSLVSPAGNLTTSPSPGHHKPMKSDLFLLSSKDLQSPPTAQLDDTDPGLTMDTEVVSLKAKQTQLDASAAQTTANASAEDKTPRTSVDSQAPHSPSSAAHDLPQAEATSQNTSDTSLEQRPCPDPSSPHDRSQAKAKTTKRYYPKENILITFSLPKNDASALSSVRELPNKTSSNMIQSRDSNNFVADKNHENDLLQFNRIIPERTEGGHNFEGKLTCSTFATQSGRADQNNRVRSESKHSKLAPTPPTSHKGSHQKEQELQDRLNPSAAVSHASVETAEKEILPAIPKDVSSNLCLNRFPKERVLPETAAKSIQNPTVSCDEKPDAVDHTGTSFAANMASTELSRSLREPCIKKPAELDYTRTAADAGTVQSAADFSRRSRETRAEKPEEVDNARTHTAGDNVAFSAELKSAPCKQAEASSQTALPGVKRGPETASVGGLAALTTASSSARGAEDSETSASGLTFSVPSTTERPLNSDKTPAVSPNNQPNADSPEDPEASNQEDASLTGPHGGREYLRSHVRTTPLESSSSPTGQEVVTMPSASDSEQRRPVMVSDHSGHDSLAAVHSDQTVQGGASSSRFLPVQLQTSQTPCASDGPSGQRTSSLSPGHSPEPVGCTRHKMSSSDSHSRVAGVPPVDARDPGTPADPRAREARPHSTLPDSPDSVTVPVISIREGKELLQKLEDENAALKEKRTCRVCYAADWDHVPSGCGHLICLQCHLKLDEGKCPFCRERNSLVWRALRGDESGPQRKLDLFTPAGEKPSTPMLPPARTADDQVLADLPPALHMPAPLTRADFDLGGARTVSRTQLLDLTLEIGRGKVPANVRMGTVECRYASFRAFHPQMPCPMELAKAGLCGDHHQDHPQCFHCGGRVVVELDPLTCHAKQFPGCRYVHRLLPVPKCPEFQWRRSSL